MTELIIIGAGLAGSEAAWQAANRGIHVKLFEMRPNQMTGAHLGDKFAELVCSNSLGSKIADRASGLLKNEMRLFNSLILRCAEESEVPAGGALAVDRDSFSQKVTHEIEQHPNIQIFRKEVTQIPASTPTIIASGPLTSPALTQSLMEITRHDGLAFFDAIAPIVRAESINMEIAFRASRYDRGEQSEGDYINCPFSKEEYDNFVTELIDAQRITLREFEEEISQGVTAGLHTFFEGCLPVEVIAGRGRESLAFGPMRPVGLTDPRTGRRPFAVLQLRQDNLAGSLYNLVGFQTNLTFKEQKRVFRMIPGLENAEFERYGQMHRNTFIASPLLLDPTMQFKSDPNIFFAGQITGVEGYMGNAATGALAGINAARMLHNQPLLTLPQTTMLGALCHYITHAELKDFQPMKANFGILPPQETEIKGKRNRAKANAERAINDLQQFIKNNEPL